MDPETSLQGLLSGPNTIRKIETKAGETYFVRSGTREQRNRIEDKLGDSQNLMDGIATCLFYRLADAEGNPLAKDIPFKKFAANLDYEQAVELATLIRKLSEAAGEDDLTMDDRTESHLKKPKRQKADT